MAAITVNSYSVGTEMQSLVLQANGQSYPVQQLGHLREFNATQNVTQTTITPVVYGGLRLHRNIYHDFSGRISFDRYNASITSLMQSIAYTFQQTGAETYFTIFATIFNAFLNTTDDYLFNNCVLDGHDLGAWTGTAEVQNLIQFRCQSFVVQGATPSQILTA